jgi:hypothetical protein
MYRLIYKSRVARELDWAVVEDILHHSEANNPIFLGWSLQNYAKW